MSDTEIKRAALHGPQPGPPIYVGAAARKSSTEPQPSRTHIGPLLPSKSKVSGDTQAHAMKQKSKSVKRKPLTQMRLDLGQQVHKRCSTCGMEYRPSIAEDKKLHDKFHSRNVDGIPMNKLGTSLALSL